MRFSVLIFYFGIATVAARLDFSDVSNWGIKEYLEILSIKTICKVKSKKRGDLGQLLKGK
jgi:hypothetical protein